MAHRLRFAAATALVLAAGAQAQTAAAAPAAPGVLVQRNLSLAAANQIATAAVAACAASGYAVSATVVDRAGVVRAVQRADNAGPHTLGSSERKAWTSASAKAPTQAIMEGAQKNAAAANLVNIPGYLLLGGGVPVKAGDEVIGGVGVGGAPGGHLDEQCANAALEQVKGLLN